MASLPDHFDRPVHIAVIGGTGLGHLDGYTPVASLNITTPWGPTSAPILVLEHAGVPVAFLARHGTHHQLAPHEIPTRANIAALRSLGVRSVIAFSAVGSLREEIPPMTFVIPDQIIDRTKGIRPFTFFEGGLVGHVPFADPFDSGLASVVESCARSVLAADGNKTVHRGGTVVCMEGPQFSTRAESHMYRAWGGDVINMSALPEAKLAREAELSYQMVCMATDYDCWRAGHDDVSVDMVMKYMEANGQNARRLMAAVLDELSKAEHAELVQGKHLVGAATGPALWCTKPEGRDPEAVRRIQFLFPDVFKS